MLVAKLFCAPARGSIRFEPVAKPSETGAQARAWSQTYRTPRSTKRQVDLLAKPPDGQCGRAFARES